MPQAIMTIYINITGSILISQLEKDHSMIETRRLKKCCHFFPNKYFYCHRIYNCVKNIVIFYVEFTKTIILFSIFIPLFFIRKFISVAKPFLKGEWGN